MRKSTLLQSNKQPVRSTTSTMRQHAVDLVKKSRSTDGSDVKTEAIEEQIYSISDDPEQIDVAHDPTGGDGVFKVGLFCWAID